jgi:hypothetical protein
VLLRAVARLGGEDFHRIEVEQVAFDEALPEGTFTFVPPPGVDVRDPHRPGKASVRNTAELARLAPFAVFTPATVPAGWSVHLSYFDGPPGQAHLHYHAGDGAGGFSISEAAAGAPVLEGLDSLDTPDRWRSVERDGLALSVREPPEEWASAAVRLERDGTRIELTSESMTAGDLVEIAAALRPAPARPRFPS